jgi:hypothetical protein
VALANNFYGRQLASQLLGSDLSNEQFIVRLFDAVERFVKVQNDACWIRNWENGQTNGMNPVYNRPSRCGIG